MTNKVLIKRSAVASKVPTTGQLDLGELGINTYDGILYLKKDPGTPEVIQIGSNLDLSHFGTDLRDTFGFMHGATLDPTAITVTSNGTVVTLSLEKSGTGDIRFIFSDGVYTLDCTPASTATITAGSDIAPTLNYVYVLQSNKTLTVSTSGWPAAEYAPIATVYAQSAASLQTDGAYKVHAWSDHTKDSNDEGHLAHLNYWVRSQPATWLDGVAITVTDGSATLDIATTSGTVLQLHDHTFPAFDTSVSDSVFVVNHPDTAYKKCSSLTIADGVDKTTAGTLLGGGTTSFYNLVVWGVVNEATGDCKLMVNVPTDGYALNSSGQATNDDNNTAVYRIPAEFTGTGFLICRITVQEATGPTYTEVAVQDLRGLIPANASGGSGGTTGANVFSDNVFRIEDEGDSTKEIAFQASGITTATTRTITMPDADVDLGAFLTDVVDDTTPQLGGTLDVNDQIIEAKPNGGAGNAGNDVTIQATDGGSSGLNPGGDLFLKGGGIDTIIAGAEINMLGAIHNGKAGSIEILAGDPQAFTNNPGGDVTIEAGGGGVTGTTSGGEVYIKSGQGGTTGIGGDIHMTLRTGGSGDGAFILDTTSSNTNPRFRITSKTGTGGVYLTVPDISSVYRTWTLPDDDPAVVSGGYLKTDASGVLSFGTPSGLQDVVDDTTPQLGGPLDVNNNDIVGAPAATATSPGGDIQLTAADGGATSGDGGWIILSAGFPTTAGSGGEIDLTSGDGIGAGGAGGNITLSLGEGDVSAAGGSFQVTSGDGGGTNGAGGSVSLTGGSGFGTGVGGHVTLTAGSGANSPGNVYIYGGQNTNDEGGFIQLSPGKGVDSSNNSVRLVPTALATETAGLDFYEISTNGTNRVRLRAPTSITTNRNWILPQDDPSTANGKYLTTDASGNLSFGDPAGTGLQDVVDDTSPQLGGHLDIQASYIYSSGTNLRIRYPSTVSTGTASSITIEAQGHTGTGGFGGNTTIEAGTSSGTSGSAGTMFVNGGDGTIFGGDVKITAGNATAGSSSGGNVYLSPGYNSNTGFNAGYVRISAADGNASPQLRLYEARDNGTNYVSIRAPNDVTTTRSWWLPQDDPTTASGKFLTTNASGEWSFTDGGNVSNTGTPVNNQLAVWTDATTVEGDAKLTWTGFNLVLNDTNPITLASALGNISRSGGNLTLIAGSATFSDSWSHLELVNNGGATLHAADNTTTTGYTLNLEAGDTTAATSAGGAVSITGGTGGASGAGGAVSITAGAGGATTGDGGDLTLSAGAGQNIGGEVVINAGDNTNDVGGYIVLRPGDSVDNGSSQVRVAAKSGNEPATLCILEAPANGTNYVGLKVPTSITTNRFWTLPVDDPTTANGKYLKAGANGVLSFDTPAAASPLTTKGDLFTYDTADQRLPIGTNDQVLTADSAQPTGMKWATPSAGTPDAVLTSFVFTATASQTVFSGADDNADTLAYTVGDVYVYQNGALQDPADYTATNGTSITLDTGATVDDIIMVLTSSTGTFASTNTYTATAAQTTFTGADDNSKALSYNVGDPIFVFINGVLQKPSDYAADTGTSIVLDTAAEASDIVMIFTTWAMGVTGFEAVASSPFYYTATASQTTFSGADNNSNLLAYSPGSVYVYVNGVLQDPGEYTATSGTSVILDEAAALNDSVIIVASDGANDIITTSTIPELKNHIINGNFDFWQRGTSFTTTGYAADRWITAFSNYTATTTKQTFTLGQTDVPGNPDNYYRIVTTSNTGVGDYCHVTQKMERVARFSGETVTVSFWAKCSSALDIAVEMRQHFGTGGSPSATVKMTPQTVSLTTGWAKYTLQFAIDSVTGKTLGSDGNDYTDLIFWLGSGSNFDARTNSMGHQSGTFEFSKVQIERGSDVTSFEHRSLQQELAMCQRYFEKSYDTTSDPGTAEQDGMGWSYNVLSSAIGTRAGIKVNFKVEKRASPTIVSYSPATGTSARIRDYGNAADRAVTFIGTGTSGFAVYPSSAMTATANIQVGAHWTADAEL